jgi:hypothetical protein
MQAESASKPSQDAYKQGMHLYEANTPLFAMGFKNTREFEDITFAVGSYCIEEPQAQTVSNPF